MVTVAECIGEQPYLSVGAPGAPDVSSLIPLPTIQLTWYPHFRIPGPVVMIDQAYRLIYGVWTILRFFFKKVGQFSFYYSAVDSVVVVGARYLLSTKFIFFLCLAVR